MFNEEERTKQFDLVSFLGFLAWMFLGASLFAVPLLMIAPVIMGMSSEDYLASGLLNEHQYIVAVLSHTLGVILFVFLYKKTIKDDFKNFISKWWKFLIVIIVGFGLLYLSNYLMGIIYEKLGLGGQTSQNQQGIIDALNGSTVPFVVMYTVILAPIFEEIVFRKLFYTALKKFTKLPSWAIVLIISAAFAFIHVSDAQSLVFFPQYFVLALLITGAYALTKENLFVSIGLHFLNNFVAVLEILL